jgi:Ca2+-binding EF-hand superfamily protein
MISGIGGSSDMWNQMNIRLTKSKEQIFNRMDQDGNGGIDKSELAAVLEKMSEKTGTTVDTDQLFSQYNSDDDKELSQDETKNLMESLRTEASQLGGMQAMPGMMGMGGMQGGPPPGPPPDSEQMFKDTDTDSSGGVSQDELQALLDKTKSSTGQSTDVLELFETYDSDGDGELNADETKSALESLMSSNQDAGGMREMGPMPPPPPDFSRMFQDADTDSDGSIGKSELQAIADKFSNGSTTSPSINIEELLAQNDSDSDGKLDESEAKNAIDSLFKALQPDAKTIKNLFYQSSSYKPVDITA